MPSVGKDLAERQQQGRMAKLCALLRCCQVCVRAVDCKGNPTSVSGPFEVS